MEPTPELIDQLFRERILRARQESPEEKLLDGLRLFDRTCRIMRDGIRWQFPEASPDEVERILDRRLEIARVLENRP